MVLKALLFVVNFKLVKGNYFIHLITVVLLLLALACKHKEKAIHTKDKKKPTKTAVSHKGGAAPKTTSSRNKSELEEKLGVNEKQINNNKLYSFVKEWYGIPYKYGGCKKTGVDCSCFASILYEHIYGKGISRTAGEMFAQCEKIGRSQVHEGDLLFFKINSNAISHVGVYIKSDFFVHSSASKGVVISNMNEAYYEKYFYCAGRIKKL